MSAITLVNQVPESNTASAEFRLLRGESMVARVGVYAGGKASVPSQGTGFTAVAMTQMNSMSLTSNEVSFSSGSQVLLAQFVSASGVPCFQLVAAPGTQDKAIVCENTWREPVQFIITEPGTPFQVVTVVDEHNTAPVTTVQQWECYAIVNGITTATVTITDPNAVVTLLAEEDGYTLALGQPAEAQTSELKVVPAKAEDAEPAAPAKAPEPERTEDASIEAQVLTVTSAA